MSFEFFKFIAIVSNPAFELGKEPCPSGTEHPVIVMVESAALMRSNPVQTPYGAAPDTKAVDADPGNTDNDGAAEISVAANAAGMET